LMSRLMIVVIGEGGVGKSAVTLPLYKIDL